MYNCFRKFNTSSAFFSGNGISLASASLNWLLNMALKTGEWMLSICRWTWNLSFSTTSTKSLSSQDSEKGFVSFLSCNTETKPEIQRCNPLTSLFFYWSFTEFGSTAIETQVKWWPAVHYVDQTVSDAIFLNTKLWVMFEQNTSNSLKESLYEYKTSMNWKEITKKNHLLRWKRTRGVMTSKKGINGWK